MPWLSATVPVAGQPHRDAPGCPMRDPVGHATLCGATAGLPPPSGSSTRERPGETSPPSSPLPPNLSPRVTSWWGRGGQREGTPARPCPLHAAQRGGRPGQPRRGGPGGGGGSAVLSPPPGGGSSVCVSVCLCLCVCVGVSPPAPAALPPRGDSPGCRPHRHHTGPEERGERGGNFSAIYGAGGLGESG